MNYEKYCAICKENKIENPYKTEDEFNRAYGIVENREVEPMILKPKKQVVNKCLNTDEHVIKELKPKKRKPRTEEQKKRDNKRKNEIRKAKRRLNPNFKNRTDLSNMTPEEVKAHRSRLQKERMEKKRAEGWKEPPRTELQREQRKEYFRRYHQVKKSDPNYMAKKSEIQKRHYYSKKEKLEGFDE